MRERIKLDKQCAVFKIDSLTELCLGDVISWGTSGSNHIVVGFTQKSIEILDPESGQLEYWPKTNPVEGIIVWDARDPDFNTEPLR